MRLARFLLSPPLRFQRLPGVKSEAGERLHLPPPRQIPPPPKKNNLSAPSFLVHLLLSSSSSPPLATAPPNSHLPTTPSSHPLAPNIFNYIFSQVLRLSNQGADIDACADKSANTGNKINKDFEERVTANFAQWSAPHSRVRFLIERAMPVNSCSAPQKGVGGDERGWVGSRRSCAAFALSKL